MLVRNSAVRSGVYRTATEIHHGVPTGDNSNSRAVNDVGLCVMHEYIPI